MPDGAKLFFSKQKFLRGPGPTAWGGISGPEGHLVSRLIAAHNFLLSA